MAVINVAATKDAFVDISKITLDMAKNLPQAEFMINKLFSFL